MKVLVVSSSVYTSSISKSSITGLAVMVRDIFDEVSKHCDVYVWASQTNMPAERISESFQILPGGIKSWLKGVRFIDIAEAIQHSCFRPHKMKSYLRKKAVKRLQMKTFKRTVNTIKPDIVSFHDFDDLNTELVQYCDLEGIKAVITNHLYIGKADGCSNYDYARRNENILLNQPQLKFSVISTGMKRRMMHDYSKLKPENIYITLDGTSFLAEPVKKPQRESRKKVILCVANVMERKNQVQLVRALSLFEKKYRQQFIVYFLGSDPNGLLMQAIEKCQCSDVAAYKGKVRPEEMKDYYQEAFATITTTLCEGFGLTMIEGYAYGLPAILPNDIDSFEDIYSENCSIVIKGREDEDIVRAIMQCIETKWNPDLIRAKAKEFSMNNVAINYVNMYKDIISKH